MKEECKNDQRGDRSTKGYFKIGTEPKERCSMHKEIIVKNDSGGSFFFDWFTKKKKMVLLDYTRKELIDIKIEDEDYLIKSKKRENS